jgi:hypothetical protein
MRPNEDRLSPPNEYDRASVRLAVGRRVQGGRRFLSNKRTGATSSRGGRSISMSRAQPNGQRAYDKGANVAGHGRDGTRRT